MKNSVEIIYNFKKIDESIHDLQSLKNRAIACSNIMFTVNESDGDSKIALLDAYDAMTDCASSVAIMLEDMIVFLNNAKTRMKQDDAVLKKKINDHTT